MTHEAKFSDDKERSRRETATTPFDKGGAV